MCLSCDRWIEAEDLNDVACPYHPGPIEVPISPLSYTYLRIICIHFSFELM